MNNQQEILTTITIAHVWVASTPDSIHGHPSKNEPCPTKLDMGCGATSKGKPGGSMARRGVRQGPGPRPAPVWWSRRSWESWGSVYQVDIPRFLSTHSAFTCIRKSAAEHYYGTKWLLSSLPTTMCPPRSRSRRLKNGTERDCDVAAVAVAADVYVDARARPASSINPGGKKGKMVLDWRVDMK